MGAVLGTLNNYVCNIILMSLLYRINVPPSYEILRSARLHRSRILCYPIPRIGDIHNGYREYPR